MDKTFDASAVNKLAEMHKQAAGPSHDALGRSRGKQHMDQMQQTQRELSAKQNKVMPDGLPQGAGGPLYEMVAKKLVKELQSGNAPQVQALAHDFIGATHHVKDVRNLSPAYFQHTFVQLRRIYDDPSTNALERDAAVNAMALIKMRANGH